MSEVMCSHVPSDYDMLVVETAKPKGTLEMFKLMRTFVYSLYNLLAFNHYLNHLKFKICRLNSPGIRCGKKDTLTSQRGCRWW